VRSWRDSRAEHPPELDAELEPGVWEVFEYDLFDFANGGAYVHRRELCEARGAPCCLHSPSEHGTRDLPMLLRETTLVERLCPHGVGHPDPDAASYFESIGRQGMGVHGCDGCCGADWTQELYIAGVEAQVRRDAEWERTHAEEAEARRARAATDLAEFERWKAEQVEKAARARQALNDLEGL
jgi:hypothetical protein